VHSGTLAQPTAGTESRLSARPCVDHASYALDSPTLPQIVISRPEEKWANRLRSYQVVVDGSAATSLNNGGEETVTVAAGHHRVEAKIDWGRSPAVELDLGERDRAYLICQAGFKPSLLRPTVWLYITVWRKRYLDLRLLRIESSA
jgi:hypothetical protein